MHADVHRFARSSTVFRAGFDHHRRFRRRTRRTRGEENAADDDEDGSARKKPKLSHENYTMAQITSMVCSYAAEEGKDLEEIFSKIRSAAAESAREHIQRDRRRLEMHASRLDKNI